MIGDACGGGGGAGGLKGNAIGIPDACICRGTGGGGTSQGSGSGEGIGGTERCGGMRGTGSPSPDEAERPPAERGRLRDEGM